MLTAVLAESDTSRQPTLVDDSDWGECYLMKNSHDRSMGFKSSQANRL